LPGYSLTQISLRAPLELLVE